MPARRRIWRNLRPGERLLLRVLDGGPPQAVTVVDVLGQHGTGTVRVRHANGYEEFVAMVDLTVPVKAKGKPPRANPPRGAARVRQMLSDEVIEIRYKHAADGKLYKHAFAKGVCLTVQANGTVLLWHASGKRLWDTFDV